VQGVFSLVLIGMARKGEVLTAFVLTRWEAISFAWWRYW